MPYQSLLAESAHEVPNASVVVAVTAVTAPEDSDAAFSVPDASVQFGFMIVEPIVPVVVAVTAGMLGAVPVTSW